MTLKQFIKNFTFNNPNWSHLPTDFPNCDLEGLNSAQVGQFSAIKHLWQLSQPDKPKTAPESGNLQMAISILSPGQTQVCSDS